ncbi:ATP-grasp domain-containing protein [Epibacterium sp. DP7N7-1]|nr:ATP-grasp domain-containing protein [Epibacterium sp. DP7N7-1]
MSPDRQARGPVHLIFQEDLLRGMDPALDVLLAGHVPHVFSSSDDWKTRLEALNRELGPVTPLEPETGARVAVFCSLQVAAHIRRHCDHLRQGILQDEDRLAIHVFTGLIPRDWLLNRDVILLPFGQVEARAAQLETLFGPRLFMRPDSSKKTFSGCVFDISDIGHEVSAQRQIHNIHGDELVAIDRARDIAPFEYRFWLAEGRVITHAAYALERIEDAPPCPPTVARLAEEVARHVEYTLPMVVADFVLDEGGQPRLVEVNGFSTAGFYPGTDFHALVTALDGLIY